jgi:hypothetical protein
MTQIRRLAAVLAADGVGYSPVTSADDVWPVTRANIAGATG